MGGRSALATKRKKKKETRAKRTFNRVLGDVMAIQDKLERIQEEVGNKDFPKNNSTGLLVDMLVQVKKSSDDIKKRALDKSFVYGNIELLHNRTLKKMFEKDPELEAMVVKRRVTKKNGTKKSNNKRNARRATKNRS